MSTQVETLAVLCTADCFVAQQRKLPLPSFLESTLAAMFHHKRLVECSQLTDVVNGTTQDGYLRDAAVASRAWYHVAEAVEVAFEVVATLALHDVVLGPLVSLVVLTTTV